MKRGQVTLFVILGLIIISVIAVGFFLRKDIAQKIQDVKISQNVVLQQQTEEVKPIVDNCVSSALQDSILKVFAKGGYNAPKNAVQYEYYTMPLYFDKGKEAVPSVAGIESEIASAIEKDLPLCANFNSLKFPVKALSKPVVDVSIGQIVQASVQWTLNVGTDSESAKITQFSGEAKSNLLIPYNYGIELYNKQKAIKVLSLIDLARLAKQKNFILHFDMQDDAMVYLLTFNTTIINRQPLVYTFGIRQEKPKAGESTGLLAGARAA